MNHHLRDLDIWYFYEYLGQIWWPIVRWRESRRTRYDKKFLFQCNFQQTTTQNSLYIHLGDYIYTYSLAMTIYRMLKCICWTWFEKNITYFSCYFFVLFMVFVLFLFYSFLQQNKNDWMNGLSRQIQFKLFFSDLLYVYSSYSRCCWSIYEYVSLHMSFSVWFTSTYLFTNNKDPYCFHILPYRLPAARHLFKFKRSKKSQTTPFV